ncbi:MAG: hypothetical protein Q8922_08420 [Bacteroidota bacterium]|nr:hypothetical protein [Bacteroidota bacterium]MDP4233489.1 hypothetical protein [Bacteroidota bacterium]MDP4287947.1 hypothetical protein [Bacteroidota bacterium]
MIRADTVVLYVLLIAGAGLVGILFMWLSGKRGDSSPAQRFGGFWRPPKPPEDEWQKWSND